MTYFIISLSFSLNILSAVASSTYSGLRAVRLLNHVVTIVGHTARHHAVPRSINQSVHYHLHRNVHRLANAAVYSALSQRHLLSSIARPAHWATIWN